MNRDEREEKPEHCIKCGCLRNLQGVAVTLGRQTFHLFYLCSQCGNVGQRELLRSESQDLTLQALSSLVLTSSSYFLPLIVV